MSSITQEQFNYAACAFTDWWTHHVEPSDPNVGSWQVQRSRFHDEVVHITITRVVSSPGATALKQPKGYEDVEIPWDIGGDEVFEDDPATERGETGQGRAGSPHVYDISLTYHPGYGVPALYLKGRKCDGQRVTLMEVLEDYPLLAPLVPQCSVTQLGSGSMKDSDQPVPWQFISEEDHPLLQEPWFCLHPCGTSEVMASILPGHHQDCPERCCTDCCRLEVSEALPSMNGEEPYPTGGPRADGVDCRNPTMTQPMGSLAGVPSGGQQVAHHHALVPVSKQQDELSGLGEGSRGNNGHLGPLCDARSSGEVEQPGADASSLMSHVTCAHLRYLLVWCSTVLPLVDMKLPHRTQREGVLQCPVPS